MKIGNICDAMCEERWSATPLPMPTVEATVYGSSGADTGGDRAMSDHGSPPATIFQNAEAYERIMGRWSRRLAPQLIQFGGLSDGDRVLDVGCGTGSLSFVLPEFADVSTVVGIDLAQGYVEYAKSRTTDRRVTFQQADACSLPFGDKSF
jgi:SAM-dependent methyltransferase